MRGHRLCSGFLAGLLGSGWHGHRAGVILVRSRWDSRVTRPRRWRSQPRWDHHSDLDRERMCPCGHGAMIGGVRRLAPAIVAVRSAGAFWRRHRGRATLALFIAFALYSIRRLVAGRRSQTRGHRGPVPEGSAVGRALRLDAVGPGGVGGALLSCRAGAPLPIETRDRDCGGAGLAAGGGCGDGVLLAGRPGHCLDGCVATYFSAAWTTSLAAVVPRRWARAWPIGCGRDAEQGSGWL